MRALDLFASIGSGISSRRRRFFWTAISSITYWSKLRRLRQARITRSRQAALAADRNISRRTVVASIRVAVTGVVAIIVVIAAMAFVVHEAVEIDLI